MLERKVSTILDKRTRLKYNHLPGTSVTMVDFYFNKAGDQIGFTAPNVSGLYFQQAKKLLHEASKKKVDVINSEGLCNPTDPEQGHAFLDEKLILDFFSLASAGIILLFNAIEAEVNSAIENYRGKNLYKRKENLTLIRILSFSLKLMVERKIPKDKILFLGIEEKLKKVFCVLYDSEPIQQKDFWQSFMRLKYFRDNLTHPKKYGTYGVGMGKNSVFAEFIDCDFARLVKDTEEIISFLYSYKIDN